MIHFFIFLADMIMEVNNARELIENRPGLAAQERPASGNAAGGYEDVEAGLTESQITEKPSSAKSGNGSTAKENVGSVEYTRNNDFDDANGSLIQEPSPTAGFAIWRAQADQAMIRCIKEDDTHHTYFTRPPVNPITMFFYQINQSIYSILFWHIFFYNSFFFI